MTLLETLMLQTINEFSNRLKTACGITHEAAKHSLATTEEIESKDGYINTLVAEKADLEESRNSFRSLYQRKLEEVGKLRIQVRDLKDAATVITAAPGVVPAQQVIDQLKAAAVHAPIDNGHVGTHEAVGPHNDFLRNSGITTKQIALLVKFWERTPEAIPEAIQESVRKLGKGYERVNAQYECKDIYIDTLLPVVFNLKNTLVHAYNYLLAFHIGNAHVLDKASISALLDTTYLEIGKPLPAQTFPDPKLNPKTSMSAIQERAQLLAAGNNTQEAPSATAEIGGALPSTRSFETSDNLAPVSEPSVTEPVNQQAKGVEQVDAPNKGVIKFRLSPGAVHEISGETKEDRDSRIHAITPEEKQRLQARLEKLSIEKGSRLAAKLFIQKEWDDAHARLLQSPIVPGDTVCLKNDLTKIGTVTEVSTY